MHDLSFFRFATIFLFSCAGSLSWSCTSSTAKDITGYLPDSRGLSRRYILHLPPTAPDSSVRQATLPLVVVLHGGAQNAVVARRVTAMNKVADNHGFAVAYPDGSGRYKRHLLTWNAEGCCGFSRSRRIDDVGFVEALIDKLIADKNIDLNRVYLAGYSNGAMLAFRFACERPGKVAAISCVGGSMTGNEALPGSPVSVLMMHGTRDKHVPYYGGEGKWARWGYPVNRQSVAYSKAFWIKANSCIHKAVADVDGWIKRELYNSEQNDSEVEVYSFLGKRHSWPGGERAAFYRPKPFAGFCASEKSWEFFSRHQNMQAAMVAGTPPPVNQSLPVSNALSIKLLSSTNTGN